jgi:PH (Pleckstrin Homology) domain-containing protein
VSSDYIFTPPRAVSSDYVFTPPRSLGLIIQGGLILALAAAAGFGLWQASRATIGPQFLLYLSLSLLVVALIPALVYRFYALRGAAYALERDGIRLRWGLRSEVIPMDAILSVRPWSELTRPLPLPLLRWPGGVLGVRRLSSGEEVEYLASRWKDLVLISTRRRIFVISPADSEGFIYTFQRLTELGSLTPLKARSVYPTFLLARVWEARPARILLLSGLALSLVLLGWVSLAVPSREQVYLGFHPANRARDLVPALRLLLLPVLNSMIFLLDFLLGLFFFRREEPPAGLHVSGPALAYLVWSGAAITPLLFLIAVFFILQAGG